MWDLWRLSDCYRVEWTEDGRKCVLYIYTGTFWDGASIPRVLTPIMPRRGINDAASLVHDTLFESRGHPHTTHKYIEDGKEVKRVFTLEGVNTLFYKLLSYHKYPILRGMLGVLAVGVASPYLWNNHKGKIHSKIKKHLEECEHK